MNEANMNNDKTRDEMIAAAEEFQYEQKRQGYTFKWSRESAVSFALEQLAQANDRSAWVADKQPTNEGLYLVTTKWGNVQTESYRFGVGWRQDVQNRVIAWQPLPQPYSPKTSTGETETEGDRHASAYQSGWVAINSVEDLPKEDTQGFWKKRRLPISEAECLHYSPTFGDAYKQQLVKKYEAYMPIPPYSPNPSTGETETGEK